MGVWVIYGMIRQGVNRSIELHHHQLIFSSVQSSRRCCLEPPRTRASHPPNTSITLPGLRASSPRRPPPWYVPRALDGTSHPQLDWDSPQHSNACGRPWIPSTQSPTLDTHPLCHLSRVRTTPSHDDHMRLDSIPTQSSCRPTAGAAAPARRTAWLPPRPRPRATRPPRRRGPGWRAGQGGGLPASAPWRRTVRVD